MDIIELRNNQIINISRQFYVVTFRVVEKFKIHFLSKRGLFSNLPCGDTPPNQIVSSVLILAVDGLPSNRIIALTFTQRTWFV